MTLPHLPSTVTYAEGFGPGYLEALHMYEKVGFQVVERFVDARYTVELRHMRMEKCLKS